MKENGINKLIKLLNEYDDGMVSWYEEYFPTEGLFVTNAGQGFREEFILSKRYGFIQWLVQNDKIDLLRLDNRIALSEFNKVERVLMALSISNTPIDDLVSYLK